MAVFDALWLQVWWPWLLVWLAEFGLVVAAVTIVVRHWRRARRPATPSGHGVSFYLDEQFVLRLYRQFGGKYRAALTQEVEERISEGDETAISAEVSPVKIGKKGSNSSEVFRRYIEDNDAITVIGMIIDVLDAADDIIYVDLRKRDVVSNRALAKTLDIEDEAAPALVRPRELGSFVSLRGRFRLVEKTAEIATFQAPLGDSADEVLVRCAVVGLSGVTVPSAEFPARCLGQVQEWDSGTRMLTVHPIAIFR
ncbi:hypothetical protein [Alloactinosynnema sp. L-07]|uniref:hypothetical protein n=1 Tax=Alloactinosynnema sp. L-07 TaxID=1653480 RepID=UPI00065EF9F1|nr:hypothetical protein [Alloactinosynnema sp. L-07]CRK59471.1 hypothetical protein [Alloactinosynnema sp. L-07]